MAELTTITGEMIDFDSAQITAVANLDADTGEAVTCVYGVEAVALKTDETVISLLSRLGLMSRGAELIRPEASLIWIVAAAVTSLRAPMAGEYASGVKAVVISSGLTQGVTEDLQQTRHALAPLEPTCTKAAPLPAPSRPCRRSAMQLHSLRQFQGLAT